MRMQRGSAIITALFIMAIVTIAATAMSVRLQIDIRRTELTANAITAYQLGQGVPIWARQSLLADAKQKQVGKFPKKLAARREGNALVSGSLNDLQARFNINNLVLDSLGPIKPYTYSKAFAKLITIVAPNISNTQAAAIANATRAWLTPGYNLNQAYYAKQQPPYRAAQQAMVSISQLRLVRGVDQTLYQKLAPFITALPHGAAININTAPWQVLSTLSPTMNKAQATAIINARNQQGFKTLDDFSKNPIVKQLGIASGDAAAIAIATQSQYFLSRADVTLGQQHLVLFDAFKRQDSQVTLLWESRDGM